MRHEHDIEGEANCTDTSVEMTQTAETTVKLTLNITGILPNPFGDISIGGETGYKETKTWKYNLGCCRAVHLRLVFECSCVDMFFLFRWLPPRNDKEVICKLKTLVWMQDDISVQCPNCKKSPFSPV
jgi:hypothetical protein